MTCVNPQSMWLPLSCAGPDRHIKSFFVAVTNYPMKKIYCGSQFKGTQSIMAEKAQQEEHEAASHGASTARRQRDGS